MLNYESFCVVLDLLRKEYDQYAAQVENSNNSTYRRNKSYAQAQAMGSIMDELKRSYPDFAHQYYLDTLVGLHNGQSI